MAKDIWASLELIHERKECLNCGQATTVASKYCTMCNTCKEHCVLVICRAILNKSSVDPCKKKGDDDLYNMREVEVAKILSRFPYELAKQTSRFSKSLEMEGIWFAHLNAYCLVRSLRGDQWTVEEIASDDIYRMMRDLFYQFLSKGESSLTEEMRETIENTYRLPDEALDARQVILEMIFELEKEEKLVVIRQPKKCVGCGKELGKSATSVFCIDCESDNMMTNRQAIAGTMAASPPSIVQDSPSSAPPQGMHLKKD